MSDERKNKIIMDEEKFLDDFFGNDDIVEEEDDETPSEEEESPEGDSSSSPSADEIPQRTTWLTEIEEENSSLQEENSLPEEKEEHIKYLRSILENFLINEDFSVKLLNPNLSLSYNKIGIALQYFTDNNMEAYSQLLFLCMCVYNKEMKGKINKQLKDWITTQYFLIGNIDFNNVLYPTSTLRGLEFKSNSCYQDSTLICLLSIPNYYISVYILNRDLNEVVNKPNPFIKCVPTQKEDLNVRTKIQKELRQIANYMRGENDFFLSPDKKKSFYTCSNLRGLLKNCPTTYKYHETETQDASDFLVYLFSIFNVDFTKKITTTYKYEHYPTSLSNLLLHPENNANILIKKNNQEPPFIKINLNIITSQEIRLRNYLNFVVNMDDVRENNKPKMISGHPTSFILVKEQYSSPYLIFLVDRNPVLNSYAEIRSYVSAPESRRLRTKVIPDEYLNVQDVENSEIIYKLELYGIVVHTKAHYTCYIKWDKTWYYYNDMEGGKIKEVGSYISMLNCKYIDPKENGTIFFYKNIFKNE